MACYELYQQVQSRFGFFSYFYSNEGNRGRQQEMLKKRGGKRGSIEEMEHQSSPTGRHGPSKEQRGEISIACSTENCTYVLHTLCRFTAVPMMPYEKNKKNFWDPWTSPRTVLSRTLPNCFRSSPPFGLESETLDRKAFLRNPWAWSKSSALQILIDRNM